MSVRQRMEGHRPAAQPAENPRGREPRGGIDQDFTQQVDVDRIGGKALKNGDVVGQLLHR